MKNLWSRLKPNCLENPCCVVVDVLILAMIGGMYCLKSTPKYRFLAN